jgi:glycosyltransferase involved in cell wall biosynthesis
MYFPPEVGAPQVRLLALARQLQERGHEVYVVTALPNYPTGAIFDGYRGRWLIHEAVEGVPVTRTAIYPATGGNLAKRLLSYLSFTITALYGSLANPVPDYIVVESPPLFLGLTAFVAGLLRRRPYVFNVSDLWPASAKEMGLIGNPFVLGVAERLERFLYRQARWVSVQTDGIRDAVAAVVGVERTLSLPNGVDTDLFRPDATPDWRTAGEIRFVYAGTHGYAQGLDVLLDAAELLADQPGIVIVLVGDGPDKARLVDAARSRGLGNVRFEDSRPLREMPPVFTGSRASIVPLRNLPVFRGARPSKLLPSLSCATPVIFSGAGEAAELVTDNRVGLVVPPEDGAALAAAIRTLAGDAGLAAEMGENGRRLALASFSWDAIVGRWLDALAAGKQR